jgi:DNA-binding Xre family transcriptional regulator
MARRRTPIIHCQLAKILDERRISQRELARRTNLDRATIRKLCDDQWWSAISRHVLARVCGELRLKPSHLLALEWRDAEVDRRLRR